MITVNSPTLEIHRNAFSTQFQVLSGESVRHIEPAFRHCQHLTLGSLYTDAGSRISLSSRNGGANWDMVGELDSPFLTAANAPTTVNLMPGRTLFLGHFMSHYGHFLTETMSRLWAVETDIPYDNYVFFPFIFEDGKVAAQNYHEFFLSHFGFRGRHVSVLRHPAKFEEVHVPEALCVINSSANIRLKETYDRISKPFRSGLPERRIFLSRLQPYGRFPNVAGVEEIFRRLNFEIIYPETMEINAQIAHYANASLIAGFAGSALHNCVFCQPGTRLLELGDMRSSAEPLVMQQILNRLARVDASFLPYQVGTGDDGIENIAIRAADFVASAMERSTPPAAVLSWPAALTAHLAGHGDVTARGVLELGQPPQPRRQIEGLAIKTDDNAPFKIEYQVLTEAGPQAWTSDGSFIGSRGQNQSLRGLSIRLAGQQAYRFDCDCLCGFAGHENPVLARAGQVCAAPDGAPLISIALTLRLR